MPTVLMSRNSPRVHTDNRFSLHARLQCWSGSSLVQCSLGELSGRKLMTDGLSPLVPCSGTSSLLAGTAAVLHRLEIPNEW